MRSVWAIICSAFLLLSADLPCAAGGTKVWYVHGWNGPYAEKRSNDEAVKILKGIFPDSEIRVWEWDSLGTFEDCRNRADRLVRSLTEEIASLPEERRKTLILVGHSLGGRMALRTAAGLSGRGIAIRQAIFLAAAVSVDDPDCGKAFRQQLFPCTNVFCPEDNVLRDAFGIVGESRYVNALGAIGYPASAFHHQYCKTNNIDHDAEEYAACLKKRIGTPSDPPVTLNVRVLHPLEQEIKILELYKELRLYKAAEKYRYWTLCKLRRLRRSKYMIVDPTGQVRAYGTEREMRESFDDIKRQLDERKKKERREGRENGRIEPSPR